MKIISRLPSLSTIAGFFTNKILPVFLSILLVGFQVGVGRLVEQSILLFDFSILHDRLSQEIVDSMNNKAVSRSYKKLKKDRTAINETKISTLALIE